MYDNVIKINNKTYADADWRITDGIGKLTFTTTETLSELEQEFGPEIAAFIEEYDPTGETLIHQWYNRNLQSISYKRTEESDQWKVEAEFKISAYPYDETSDIRDAVDESDDAVIELAAYVTEIDESVEAADEIISNHTKILTRMETLYNQLADRVAVLENGGGN